MKRLIAAVLACATLAVSAQAVAPPPIAARAFILMDAQSGAIIAAADEATRYDPASLTKIMTAYIVFGMLRDRKLDAAQAVTVSQKAWKAEGSRMFLDPNRPVSIEDLMKGLIVQSGNDAAIALAEAAAGTEEAFVELMNRQAERMGLANTHFMNASGQPVQGHYASARDIATLALALIRDFPDQYPRYSQREFVYNRIKQSNRNRLLWTDPTVDGMKTGFTEAAGYCLVASAVREFPNLGQAGAAPGKRRLLSVVLNTSSMEARANESQKLLNWGFQAFDTVRLFDDAEPMATAEVWKGKAKQVKLGTAGGLFVTLPKGDSAKLQTRIERAEPLLAPLTKGQRVGTVKVTTASGLAVVDVALVVLEPVEQAGMFGRAWDSIRLWIR